MQHLNHFILRAGFSVVLLFFIVIAQVRLPRLISDGMVLQRDSKVLIWGWATPGERIDITFASKTYSIATNENGDWKLL